MQCEGQLPVEDIKQNSDKEEAGSAECRMWKEWGNGNGMGSGVLASVQFPKKYPRSRATRRRRNLFALT